MIDPIELASEFFEELTTIDTRIVQRAAREPCRDCGGPLYRGDYPRKPRGGLLAIAAEALKRRFSLCCGRDGCRHRATPPSVRFLGRRVYVGAIVVLASAVALAAATVSAGVRATSVPARTTRRWIGWWRGPFTASQPFVDLSARLVPAPVRENRDAGRAHAKVDRTLSGGGALAGVHTQHRTTRDLDLFYQARRSLERAPEDAKARLEAVGLRVAVQQRAEAFCRFEVRDAGETTLVDLVADPVPLAEPPVEVGRTEDSVRALERYRDKLVDEVLAQAVPE